MAVVSNSNAVFIWLKMNELHKQSRARPSREKPRLESLIKDGGRKIFVNTVLTHLHKAFQAHSVEKQVCMTPPELYDDAMFDFSRGDFSTAVTKLKSVLAADPENFDAQLALGMAYYRQGDFAAAIAEGHKAEKLRPREQLVHTNLSLFYMKAGDKVKAEHHGLQAKIESWRADANKKIAPETNKIQNDSELALAKTTPQPMKFPSQPWKKKKPSEH
jgi:Flp pilus assembly protein TadD